MADDAPGARAALRFLLSGANGEPFRPTRAWIVPRPGLKLDDWELRLDPQPEPAEEVADLKHWALFQSDEHRYLDPGGKGKAASLRRYSRSSVVTQYLRAIPSQLPVEYHATPVDRMWLLMPAIADAKRRVEYRDAIEAALPGAKILHEPEMVLEYFRLVRRELHLEKGKSSVFLVVDSGASTTNLTFVLTRKDQIVVDARTTRDRSVLRAQLGNAPDLAGQWVDREAAKRLGWGKELVGLPPAQRRAVLADIEAAKVRTALAGESTEVHGPSGAVATITTGVLEDVSDRDFGLRGNAARPRCGVGGDDAIRAPGRLTGRRGHDQR